MEVFINDEKLDLQLENEKSIKDVIEGINTWLFKNSKVIDKIVVDGKIHTQEIEDLDKYVIQDVDRLELTVIDIKELVHHSLIETKNYLEEISKYIQLKDEFMESDIERIALGIHWTLNILNRTNKIYNYDNTFSSQDFNFSQAYETLEKIKNNFDHLMDIKEFHQLNHLIKKELFQSISEWYVYLEKIISKNLEIVDISSLREKISQQIYKIITKVPDMQKLIEMIVADLQTGHQKEAMTNLQIIVGTLESIIALLQLIKSTFLLDYSNLNYENKPIEEFNKKMNDVLKEMLNAINIKDIVLITDLLTYELNPSLELYSGILKLIAKELNIEIN